VHRKPRKFSRIKIEIWKLRSRVKLEVRVRAPLVDIILMVCPSSQLIA
jgi:hypothetical protein